MYKVFYPSVIPTIGMLITGAILVYWLEESFLRLLFVIGITTISFIIIVYTTMAKNEKSMIISLIKLLKKKIFK